MTDKKEWRLIVTEPLDSYMNMAIEESLLISVGSKNSPPVLRFYSWKNPAVVIGYQQKVNEVVDVKYCKEHGIEICRRITGGGAVFKDPEGELNYGFMIEENTPNLPTGDITLLHKFMCNLLVDAFKRLGVNASFSGTNDIVVDGKKISGNALAMRHGGLVYHGTILLSVDIPKMFGPLIVPEEKNLRHQIKTAEERVTSLEQVLGKKPNVSEIINVFKQAFEERFGISFTKSKLTEAELKKAKELYKKYSDKDWIFKY